MNIKIVTYNIDCLPNKLDLKNLPWILKPMCWIYKLIKGTTEVQINDGISNADKIGEYLSTTHADIIGLQEDFNYHEDVMKPLICYNNSKYTGKIDFDNIRWFPYPRMKSDGLNLLYNKDRVHLLEDEIIPWKKSYGYFSHANDKLTKKGFRYNRLLIEDRTVDVYTVHFDADFYNPETCPDISGDLKARKSQLKQLMEYISKRDQGFPTFIIGDFNTTDLIPFNEIKPTNKVDVDRVFYMNCTPVIKEAVYDDVYLSDHQPFVTTIEIQ